MRSIFTQDELNTWSDINNPINDDYLGYGQYINVLILII